MKKITFVSVAATLLVTACSSLPLQPNAARVISSPNPAPKSCKFMGQVVGNQGNFFTGGWTSNSNLEEGSMNDLRNKAAAMGANYVQIVTNRAGNTGSWGRDGGGMQQTNVTSLGNAYSCKPSDIGL